MGPNPLTTACHGPQEPSGSRDLAADLGADAWLSIHGLGIVRIYL